MRFRDAVAELPFKFTVMTADCVLGTVPAVTANVPDVAAAATVTDAGTVR